MNLLLINILRSERNRLAVVLFLGIFLLGLPIQGTAQVRVWDYGAANNNWGNALNWSLDNIPDTAGETAQFTTLGTAAVNQPSTGLNVGQIEFAAGGIARNLTGKTTFIHGISGVGIVNNSSLAQNLNIAIRLGASQTWSAAAGDLIFGTATIDNDGNLLTIGGAFNTSISGQIVDSGGLTKTGTGTLTLSGNNSYSGLTTVSEGTLIAASSTALGATSGDTTVSAGATLALQGGVTIGTGEDLTTLNGSGVSGGGALKNNSGNNRWRGNITLGSSTTITSDSGTLSLGDTSSAKTISLGANTLIFAGAGDFLTDAAITGTGSVIKRGTGTLTYYSSVNNSYTGSTTVEEGTLILDTFNNSNGSIVGSLIIGDGIGAAGTAQAQLGPYNAGNEQIVNTASVSINTDGRLRLNGQLETFGALTMTGGAIDMDQFNAAGAAVGTLTLGGNVTGNAASTTATISGRLALGSAPRTFTIADGSPAVDMDISAVISGTTGLTKAGAGVLQLGGASTFTGNVTNNAGTIRVSADSNLGDAANAIDFNGGTLNVSSSFTASAGRTHRINGGGGTVQVDSGQTYTLAAANQLTGSGALTKTGTGILALNNSMNFTGSIAINEGTLRHGANNAIGDNVSISILDGATLDLNNFNDTVGAITFTGGTATTGSGTLMLNGDITGNASSSTANINGNLDLGFSTRIFTIADGGASPDMQVSAVISGSGVGLTKNGAGVLQLNGANTYTGETTINAGTLLLGNSHRIADASNVNLGGGTLATAGYSDTVGTLTLSANSIIDLGAGSSTLQFQDSSGVAWTGGTILTLRNWSGSAAGGGTDQVRFGASGTALTAAQVSQIRFEDPFGPASGIFGAIMLPSGEVVPIPEPETVLAAALVAGFILWRERKSLSKSGLLTALGKHLRGKA